MLEEVEEVEEAGEAGEAEETEVHLAPQVLSQSAW